MIFVIFICIQVKQHQQLRVLTSTNKRYVQPVNSNRTKQYSNKHFRPIPNEKLDDVHKLRIRRIAEKRVRTINLNKQPLPHVKMPELSQLSTVKTEAEFYRNCNKFILIFCIQFIHSSHFSELSNDQQNSMERIGQQANNPEHRDVLRPYIRGRVTKSLAPSEFKYLGKFFFSLLFFLYRIAESNQQL